jgi:hypothetical protein
MHVCCCLDCCAAIHALFRVNSSVGSLTMGSCVAHPGLTRGPHWSEFPARGANGASTWAHRGLRKGFLCTGNPPFAHADKPLAWRMGPKSPPAAEGGRPAEGGFFTRPKGGAKNMCVFYFRPAGRSPYVWYFGHCYCSFGHNRRMPGNFQTVPEAPAPPQLQGVFLGPERAKKVPLSVHSVGFVHVLLLFPGKTF